MLGMALVGDACSLSLLSLWAASPRHMPTCPSGLPSFLLKRLLSPGIHVGSQQGEWQRGVKHGKALTECSLCLDAYQGLTVQGYLWWGCRRKIPDKTKVDSRNP